MVAVTTSLRAEPSITAPVVADPFEYVFSRDVFEPGFYAEIIRNLPGDFHYTNRRYADRAIADVANVACGPITGPFWLEVLNYFMSQRWMEIVGTLFPSIWRSAVRKPVLRLIRDTEGYQIKPHTDIRAKAVSMLFYLPADDSMDECGTQILKPKSSMTCDGSKRHEWDSFDTVFTAPFVPNSMLAFARSDVSFHGTLPIGRVVRNQMLFNVDIA